MGHGSYTPYYHIDLYDSSGVKVRELFQGNPPFNPPPGVSEQDFQSTPFTNPSSQSADYYVKFYTSFWPVHDFRLSILPWITTEVREVGFKSDYKLSIWPDPTVIDPDDGQPVWVKGTSINYPAAYAPSMRPIMFAKAGFPTAPTRNVTGTFRVQLNGATVATVLNVPISSGSTDVILSDVIAQSYFEIAPGLQTPGVSNGVYTLQWQVSWDGQVTWDNIGDSGPHKIYWTYTDPLQTVFEYIDLDNNGVHSEYPELYDLALETATTAANHSVDTVEIATRVTQSILANGVHYRPNENVPGHPLNLLDVGYGQCSNFASLVRGLLRSIGVGAEMYFVWGGDSATKHLWAFRQGLWTGPSFQMVHLAHPDPVSGAGENPHFLFHAVVGAVPGAMSLFDGAYGETPSSITFDETYDLLADSWLYGLSANNRQVMSPEMWTAALIHNPVRVCIHP